MQEALSGPAVRRIKVNKADLAYFLNVTPGTLAQYLTQGTIPRAKTGLFPLAKCNHAVMEQLRRTASGRGGPAEIAKAKLIAAQAAKAEAQAGLISGDILSRTDVLAARRDFNRIIKASMLAWPTRVAGAAGGVVTPELIEIMNQEVRATLTEFADGDYERPAGLSDLLGVDGGVPASTGAAAKHMDRRKHPTAKRRQRAPRPRKALPLSTIDR